jgi:PAS domain S-box-containing protein
VDTTVTSEAQQLDRGAPAAASCKALGAVGASLSDAVYRLVFEHATDAILSVRLASGRIESANRRTEEMTCYALADLVGGSIEMLFPTAPSPSPGPEDLTATVLDMPGLHDDLRIKRADGYSVFVSVAVAHVPDRDGTLAACVLRDATERRLLEREVITKHMALKQAHEELVQVSRALEHRNRELANMSRRMAGLSRQAAVGAFTAGVAHGINNPLAAVMSTSRQLTKTADAMPASACRQRLLTLLTRQHDAGLRIQRLIEDMRKAHRGGTPHDQPMPLDIRAELDGALCLFEHRLHGIQVVRRFPELATVEGHSDELQHLFANLLDNALLAMGDHGTLVLEIATDKDRLRVAIQDTGAGLSREVRARLFEPFVTTRKDGTGLGLCVAQRLAQLHGGRVFAEDVVPHGTRFVLEMPLTQPAAASDD